MSKKSVIGNIRSRLTLSDEALLRFLPFGTWLSVLAFCSIYISHATDQKVHKIDDLSKVRQTLEAEHTETKEKLTKLSLESRVLKRAEALKLKNPELRPKKIVVTEE